MARCSDRRLFLYTTRRTFRAGALITHTHLLKTSARLLGLLAGQKLFSWHTGGALGIVQIMNLNKKKSETERGQTNQSLHDERSRTDNELNNARTYIENGAARLVNQTRKRKDDARSSTRAETDAKMERVNACPAVRAIADAERTKENLMLGAERAAADGQLKHERDKRYRVMGELLQKERGQTDLHLLSERARSDAELAGVVGELTEAVRSRDEFLEMAGHELKTPLTPLTLRLEKLAQEAAMQPESPFAERVITYLNSASKRVNKLSVLIANMLDISRWASGNMPLRLETVDFGALVVETVARYQEDAKNAGCTLEVNAPSIVGQWDELRLEQTVACLLENAIKFGAGKPIRVRLREVNQSVRLVVEDQGIGVAPEDIQHIFERFGRAVSRRNFGGLGLGLYLCRRVAEGLGGSIEASSTPGRGSTFSVSLPLVKPEAN